jgi:hypothetical protein
MLSLENLSKQLNLFAKGVGIDIQKLITALGGKVDTTALPTAVNAAIAANTNIQALNTAVTVTTAPDMITIFNQQVTDNNYKLATA